MEAGRGAAEQARKIGDQITELEAKLERARKEHRAWTAGAEGEVRVGEQLSRLEQHGWKILHDVHWPGRPKANLDHVAVGPGGVLVIDAKNWTGDVQLRGETLHHRGHSRQQETAAVTNQCSAVAVLLEPQHRSLTQGWICLVGQPGFSPSTTSGVTIVGLNALTDAILALPTVLEESSVDAIHDYLMHALAGASSPVVATTALLAGTVGSSGAPAPRRTVAVRRAAAAKTARPRGTPSGRPPSSMRSGNRSRRRNQSSCLGAVGRLVVLAVALWIGIGAIQNFATSVPASPIQPIPSIEQEEPAGDGG